MTAALWSILILVALRVQITAEDIAVACALLILIVVGFEQCRGSGHRNAAACNRWRAEKTMRLLRRRQDGSQREAHGGHQKVH